MITNLVIRSKCSTNRHHTIDHIIHMTLKICTFFCLFCIKFIFNKNNFNTNVIKKDVNRIINANLIYLGLLAQIMINQDQQNQSTSYNTEGTFSFSD
ncbi:hypothetical protein BpHYR1_028155, partial [Brachionus plicatilis]